MTEVDSARAAQRLAWTRTTLGQPDATLERASSDASFRSYWRVRSGTGSRIVMDAPPAQEDLRPWLDIGTRLHEAGLHTPEVFASDVEAGFALIEDLGSKHYLDVLADDTVDALYDDAMQALLSMQTRVSTSGMPPYDADFLHREMSLMPEWFLERHLGMTIDADTRHTLEQAFAHIVDVVDEQPRRFVHRDYHSRNLLITNGPNPGIIDFQGALAGPVTYDLASLLRDCYIRWDDDRVYPWVESYRQQLAEADEDLDVGRERFARWFDFTGLQRHLKVLGIFCRLYYRDGKQGYLDDLPRVLDYVLTACARHEGLGTLAALLSRHTQGRDVRLPRAA